MRNSMASDVVRTRTLPPQLQPLGDLAADLRWTWSHAADHLWRALDPDAWAVSANPWMLLQDVTRETLDRLAADPAIVREVQRLAEAREEYLAEGGWFAAAHPGAPIHAVAYFSMEFGLGEALPLYAGGLGVLAGDYLKAASDLGVPVIGVGLLYQEGYFRQTIDASGRQHEAYPYNDPSSLPIAPVLAADGRWLHVQLEFPGRPLYLRVWQAVVGRARLYLLDSNDPLNIPADRGITAKLYGGSPDVQFLQEAVLGIGGWRMLDALGADVDICHMNEGHAAMAVLERARCFMGRAHLSFAEALWATRAGNVFTTHTAVPAAFDRFGPGFLAQHLPYLRIYADKLGIGLPELLAFGRRDPTDESEPFNLAYLAMRGSIAANGVSALHGAVSRHLFRDLYPRWPEDEVPVAHVTNGVHAPTWDSPQADRLWESRCGKDRWLGTLTDVEHAMRGVPDEELWSLRTEARRALVEGVRHRLARQLRVRGADAAAVLGAEHVLDADALTLGFARRFASYKRLTLLLGDRSRLVRLLTDPERPLQIVVAGKAYPSDEDGKRMIAEWVQLAADPRLRDRVVFLEDYDMSLAQELVRGVDLWLNTPRRPWEASGTSGMKVLVNGGLNVSELDGWWAEAYSPAVGWAIGDGGTSDDAAWDTVEARQLYDLLERAIVPEFYDRDQRGLPTRWLERVRSSMATLAPRFSTNRMVREYVDAVYLPAAERLRARTCDGARLARELRKWETALRAGWDALRFGEVSAVPERDGYLFTATLDPGSLDPCMLRVELYADAPPGGTAVRVPMARIGDAEGGIVYSGFVATGRPAMHFTPRAVPTHRQVAVPMEAPWIRWPR